MSSGQEFASRLRDETRRALAAHLASFAGEFRSLQNGLSASVSSVEQMVRRLESGSGVDLPAAEKILADAIAETTHEHVRNRDEERSVLAHFAHEVRRKETQEEILNLLLDGAHRYAPRLVLFVTRGNQFMGWSCRGFDEATAQKLEKCVLNNAESVLLQGALEADGLTTANDIAREETLSRLLPEGVAGPWHAFPMKAIDRPVAVLLALAADGRICELEPLCVLMDLTGLCIENMALRILQDMKAARPAAPAPVAAVPEPAPAPAPGPAEEPAPEPAAVSSAPVVSQAEKVMEAAFSSTHVAEVRAEEPAYEAGIPAQEIPAAPEAEVVVPLPESPVSSEEAVSSDEVEAAPQAEVAVEPVPEEEQSREEVDAETDQVPVLERPEPVRTAVLREVQPLTEEEKLHADAKRFARLLASEIKLYNEQRVQEGRANRDIYVRLKRDIDRSRDMYEKRVSPVVSRKVDYFHDEIIRVLGDNDPSTLGSDYPGPRVES